MADAAAGPDAASVAELKRKLIDFLDYTTVGSEYHARINQMMASNKTRLVVNLSHLRDWDAQEARRFFTEPITMLPVLEAAVKDVRTREWRGCVPACLCVHTSVAVVSL